MTTARHKGLAPVRAVLGNGVVVIAKESKTTPAVTVYASLRAGTIYDPPHAPGLSHFVSRTIDRGTELRSAERIGDELDTRGVLLSVTVDRHTLALVCTCLAEDLAPTLDLLADVVMRPTFPDDEVDTRRGEILTQIRQDEDDPGRTCLRGRTQRFVRWSSSLRSSGEGVRREHRADRPRCSAEATCRALPSGFVLAGLGR